MTADLSLAKRSVLNKKAIMERSNTRSSLGERLTKKKQLVSDLFLLNKDGQLLKIDASSVFNDRKT